MLRFKADVALGLVPEIWGALFVAERVFQDVAGTEVVVTSGREGTHIPKSFHPLGRAVDLRLKHVERGSWGVIHQTLRARLPQYTVLLEITPPVELSNPAQWAPHLHVHYAGALAEDNPHATRHV